MEKEEELEIMELFYWQHTDPNEDIFFTICKVGTGFTDETLEEITKSLKQHIIKNKHPRVNSR